MARLGGERRSQMPSLCTLADGCLAARPLGVDGHFRLVHSARAGRLLLRQLKNIALAKRKIDVYRAKARGILSPIGRHFP